MKTKILLRALSLFLVLCSIISIFPLSAFATHEHGSDHCIDENCNTCDLPLVGEGITVALLDSGVRSYPVHTAVDFVGAEEVSSHGDEMAEVLLENAPGVTLLDVRVLNAEGIGVHSKVSEGILWATNHGAQIIVMSFAGLENSRILREAVEYAAEMGVVMVAAAGNDMKNTATFPAAYAQVLSVGALDAQGGIALGSNSGAYVDLYVEAQGGTSHAAQVVAANIAKLMQSRPEATAREIYEELSELEEKTALMNETNEEGTVYASACLFHRWGGYTTTRSPSCTSTGQKVRYCTKCGKAQYATIAKLGHSARSYYNTISYATCTSAGSKVKYCVRCSYVFERVTLNALGHSWSGYTTTKAATCTATGQKCKTCTRCGTKSYTTIAALGHSKSSSPSLTVQATCTKEGYSVYRCVRCSVELSRITLAKRAHTLGSYTVVKAPTCTQQGTQAQICSSCKGQFNSKSIPATGHSYGNYVTTKNPTCTETGLKVKKCSECGSQSSSTIAKIPHAIYTEEKRELSDICEATYYTRTRCKNCDTYFGGFEESRRGTEHNLGSETVLKAPTCTETGIRGQKCTRCGLSFNTTPISKLPHDTYTAVNVEKSDICEVTYYTWTHCYNCDTFFGYTTRRDVEHTPGDYVTVKEPTCLEAGEIARYCTDCGLRTATVTGDPALGHDEKKVVVEQAYCVGEGRANYVCTRCEKTVRTKTIPATGVHNFTEEIRVHGSCHVAEERVKKCRDCGFEEEYTLTAEWFKHEHERAGYFCKKEYNGSQELYCRQCQLFVEFRGISGSWSEHIGLTTYNYIYLNSKETEKLIEQIETVGGAFGLIGQLIVDIATFYTIQDIKAAAAPGRGIVIEQQFDGVTGAQSFLIIYSQ